MASNLTTSENRTQSKQWITMCAMQLFDCFQEPKCDRDGKLEKQE